jgi:hypothetical protein
MARVPLPIYRISLKDRCQRLSCRLGTESLSRSTNSRLHNSVCRIQVTKSVTNIQRDLAGLDPLEACTIAPESFKSGVDER